MWTAGEEEDLGVLRGGSKHRPEPVETSRIGPPKNVVEHDRRAARIANQRRAREPCQNGKLLAESDTELCDFEFNSVACNPRDAQVIRKFDAKRISQHELAQRLDLATEWFGVVLASFVSSLAHRFEQRPRGSGPPKKSLQLVFGDCEALLRLDELTVESRGAGVLEDAGDSGAFDIQSVQSRTDARQVRASLSEFGRQVGFLRERLIRRRKRSPLDFDCSERLVEPALHFFGCLSQCEPLKFGLSPGNFLVYRLESLGVSESSPFQFVQLGPRGSDLLGNYPLGLLGSCAVRRIRHGKRFCGVERGRPICTNF